MYLGLGETEPSTPTLVRLWKERMEGFYPSLKVSFGIVNNKSHVASAEENMNRAFLFYYHNQ